MMMFALSQHLKVVFCMSLLCLWLTRVTTVTTVTTANQMAVSCWNFTRNFRACGQILLAWICIPAAKWRWALDSLTFWRVWMLPSMYFHEYWIGRLNQMKVVTFLKANCQPTCQKVMSNLYEWYNMNGLISIEKKLYLPHHNPGNSTCNNFFTCYFF